MAEIAFITGATSGIGEACARLLAEKGYRLIISGRRVNRLTTLKEELQYRFNSDILDLPLDVRDQPAVDKAIGSLGDDWKDIDVLINDAGLALGMTGIGEGDLADWDQMIDTNIKGLLYVSRAIIPEMMARKKGHILNISSIAGREAYPNGNVYCATKSAVEAISKSMRMDLVTYGIRVSNISPGAVETEFSLVRFHGDSERAKRVYQGFQPLSAEDIARVVLFVVTSPPNVNIDDILITPVNQASATIFHRTG